MGAEKARKKAVERSHCRGLWRGRCPAALGKLHGDCPGESPRGPLALAPGSPQWGFRRGAHARMNPCGPSRGPAALRFHRGAPLSSALLVREGTPRCPRAGRPEHSSHAPSRSVTQGPAAGPAPQTRAGGSWGCACSHPQDAQHLPTGGPHGQIRTPACHMVRGSGAEPRGGREP